MHSPFDTWIYDAASAREMSLRQRAAVAPVRAKMRSDRVEPGFDNGAAILGPLVATLPLAFGAAALTLVYGGGILLAALVYSLGGGAIFLGLAVFAARGRIAALPRPAPERERKTDLLRWSLHHG